MSKFYEHRLRMEDHYTYIMVPELTLGITTYLENHHIPYEVMKWWFAPRNISFEDQLFFNKQNTDELPVVIIKSKCNREDLFEIAQETDLLQASEIGDEYSPSEEYNKSKEHYLNILRHGHFSKAEMDQEAIDYDKKHESKPRHYEVYRTVFKD